MFVFQYLLSFWTYSYDWEIDVILYSVFVPSVILYQIFSCLSRPSWFSILMSANSSAKWLQHHLFIYSSCIRHLGDSRLFIKTNYPLVNTCMHAYILPVDGILSEAPVLFRGCKNGMQMWNPLQGALSVVCTSKSELLINYSVVVSVENCSMGENDPWTQLQLDTEWPIGYTWSSPVWPARVSTLQLLKPGG